ncbi:YdeI family protein [Paenibacillus sp. NFR01]|uniref:YdeI/OmpD-associated family protein n=1 Tax=Paenibacillus sp. NFR01 TaxID=1566279 RepID=UPI0008C998E5|nr:DUF1801 domain-containing protein [Paenibacillus sp. NFR01]SEU28029.1 Uncharacterized conserved protein YdeI, YjbR/CyaY-like superfamily, DUF1801 family [Paenibacillus sp. NFR01]
MMEQKKNPKVAFFFEKADKWKEAFEALRNIVLDTPLTEELKWGVPCYTLDGKNVLLIHGFKEYCAILFPKGALIKDSHGLLIQQTEKVQAARQIRFTSAQEIAELAPLLKDYIGEAMDIEKAGLKVELKKHEEYEIPEELQQKFAELPELKTAFEALTPGRQRAYLMFFAQPKQTKTRIARIEKSTQAIFEGKGLND